MSPIRSAAIVLGAALLAAVLVAPPAYADCYTESDPAGDMGLEVVRSDETKLWPAPAHHKLDIRHVVVRHTEQSVSIRAVVRHLTPARGDDEFFSLEGYVKVGPAQPSENVAWWQWRVDFTDDQEAEGGWVVDAEQGEDYPCVVGDEGFAGHANYDRHQITVTIPRHCFVYPTNVPQWVQVSVTTWHHRGRNQHQHSYFDHLGPGNLHFTPRLYPG